MQLFCWTCLATGYTALANTIGINYGTLGDNLPTPTAAVAAIKSMKIGRVKIFNPDATILTALKNSGLDAVVAIPNDQIAGIAANNSAADTWIQTNIAAYYPATNFVTILVGNEIFSDSSLSSTWTQLVPAMQNLYTSLKTRGWSGNIKISTAVALDVLATSYPPSTGAFRSDISTSVIQPLLSFLSSTYSYFYVNVYPFLAYSSSSSDISLNYALFGANANSVVDGAYTYTNLLDAQLDAVNSATTKLGYGDVRLAVGETGWPTKGDATQTGANIVNAEDYNRRLVRKILSTTSVGTPLRPGIFIPTYIFALFNEDLKPGATSERNWGLLYPDLTPVYSIDLTGQLTDNQYSPSPPAAASPPASNSSTPSPPPPATNTSAPPVLLTPASSPSSGTWCVTNPASDNTTITDALNYACGTSTSICSAIQVNQNCYAPNTLDSHASWAFNNYYQTYKTAGGSCFFGGAAILTSTDPSKQANHTSTNI